MDVLRTGLLQKYKFLYFSAIVFQSALLCSAQMHVSSDGRVAHMEVVPATRVCHLSCLENRHHLEDLLKNRVVFVDQRILTWNAYVIDFSKVSQIVRCLATQY